MNKRYFTVILIISVVLGGLYALYTWDNTPPPPVLSEAKETLLSAQQALALAEQASREALAVRQSLAREVKARAEVIHREVADYDADRIADELNALCSGKR